jgi:23S rRNA (uracil1939-C5)-methyltransferase
MPERTRFFISEGSFIVNEVTIEKWVYGGSGLARTEAGVALVPFVLPGEKVHIGPVRKSHAALEAVLEPSPDRVAPPCPLFTRCGGCHYQHAPYPFQLARKVEILREQLQRVGKITFDGEIRVVSAGPLGYRNRVQVHVSGGHVGFLQAGSHTLAPIPGECAIASPRLNRFLAALRERVHDPRWPRFTNERDLQVNVVEAEKPVARRFYEWMESVVALDYETSVGTFRVSPKSFFQVNRYLIDALVTEATGGRRGGFALDLYAGVGLFALPLARQFSRVTAVEAGSAAAHYLRFNAGRAGAGVEAVYARVEEFLAAFQGVPEFVLADPPRAGLGPAVTAQLQRIGPPELTIVSCDPATLARDLAALTGYRIAALTLIDLFPHTFHIETIARLDRISKGTCPVSPP